MFRRLSHTITEEHTTIKCYLPGKLSPDCSMLARPLTDFYVEHYNKISHLCNLVARNHLVERRRLSLEVPKLDTIFRPCISAGVKMSSETINGLAELHWKDFSTFPKFECKEGSSSLIGTIAKQKAINFKNHCKTNPLAVQKRSHKDFLRREELE